MFNTLIGKFTLLFWILFAIVIVPVYLYINLHVGRILETSEKEKVTLTFNTIEPILAFNLSFDQAELFEETLNSFFNHQDIYSVEMVSKHGEVLFSRLKDTEQPDVLFHFRSTVHDPFSKEMMAEVDVGYSNEHVKHLSRNLLLMFFAILFFALIIFLSGFYYIRDDLNGLKQLADWLKQYMATKHIEPMAIPGKTQEVRTIATVANEMVKHISEYVRRLHLFNKELEVRVDEAIGKQRAQEQMLLHQSRQAAMGEMLESIAHQWRQPLNNIGLAASNLETNYDFELLTKETFEGNMQVIFDNINYMSDTIDDFRNFLHPAKASHTFEPEQSVQDVIGILDAQLQNNGISHVIESNSHLDLYGVENEFKQVLLVLINNAKDAIKEQLAKGSVEKGVISISLNRQGEMGIIEVCDNGGGIEESILQSIFEPYFTTKFKNQGTGIGLYMAKNIIENRMNGRLSVKNIPAGCCFTVKLPVYEEETQ